MRILLTGATGFLGGALIPLLTKTHEVYGLTRSEPASAVDGIESVRCDLSLNLQLDRLPQRIDGVLHLAQSHAYRDFPAGAVDMFRVNVASTASLLEYARRAGASRFYLASTGSVYEPYTRGMAENAPVAPSDYYPATKLAAECLLVPYATQMTVCALRLFCLYGPGQADRLIPSLLERVRGGQPIAVEGRGGGLKLTPTYVEDTAAAIGTAFEEGWQGVVNVASPEVVSIQEIAETMGGLLGKKAVIKRVAPEELPPIIPDLTRLSKLFDLGKFRSFEAGIRSTLEG